MTSGGSASPPRHWLLAVVPRRRYGRLLIGIALFAILYPFFRLGIIGDPEHRTPALFFSLVIAYIIPVFSYITEKAEEAMTELRPLLDLGDGEFDQTYRRLSGARLPFIALQLGGGATMALVHWAILEGSLAEALSSVTGSINGLVSSVGTLLVWVVMTTVIYMLVQQAAIFARLGGRNVHATPFNVRSLAPFARVSISASLAIIGALALFPLIGLEGGTDLWEILPGSVATLFPLVAMFMLPVWPLHRRLATSKQQNLVEIDRQINQVLDTRGFLADKTEQPEQLQLLLTYRRELEECATWPFDVSNFTRLAVYLFIVPITWVAAALIENLVDSML